MENFKEASKRKLRFVTQKGLLTTEQLWDLSLDQLDALAVSLETEHKQSTTRRSFLAKTTEEDKIAKLKFDVVYDVLTTRVAENEAAQKELDKKDHNRKLLELIAAKKDEALKGKSVEELEAMML